MADESPSRARYGEAFWRAHHEAWRRSDLNQREYCEAQGIPLKAFGNWRAKFKVEPQPSARKLLYRRGGPENFNRELGRKFAYEDAVRQIWPLLGYQLRSDLYMKRERA